ncbi:PAS domain S-box protein [Caballeronia sp. LjRoot34]|uniref:PAS domain-containing sensor histidine kinase n=1 Tax=Caballeronia sp. LjRoot34 TaxID=3342325 RepID=UPI003ECF8CC3
MDAGSESPELQGEHASGSEIPIAERYRLLIDAVTDYAIFMLTPSGHVATWNMGAQKIKGYSSDEIVGRHFSVFYSDDDVAQGKPDKEIAIAVSQGRVEDEGWRVRRDGSQFWASVTITAVYDASRTLCGFAKITRDMTERRRLSELEHASELAAEIQRTREDEQKRIARELHDDLGQQLAAFKMAVAMHESHLGASGSSRRLLSETRGLQEQIDAMAATVRRIATDLRPPMLDDLGLLSALEWLADDFSRRYGVNVALNLQMGDLEFTEFAATAIFRIVQEALTNVARHAHANAVTIEMACTENVCTVRIQDDGNGVQLDAPRTQRSFGLLGMRERARQLDGTVLIDSKPGCGFQIAIQFPKRAIERNGIGVTRPLCERPDQ